MDQPEVTSAHQLCKVWPSFPISIATTEADGRPGGHKLVSLIPPAQPINHGLSTPPPFPLPSTIRVALLPELKSKQYKKPQLGR